MTPKSKRAQPARSFAEYTLTRRTSTELGLTDAPWGKMTRVIGAAVDDADVVVDLGQHFDFDGRKFDRALINSNGYIALGVTSSLQLVSTPSDNTTILSSITTSGSVMLAPWFNDLTTAVAADTPYGGVWFAHDRWDEGVRTVIRWVCRYNTDVSSAATNLLTFECVLRANGEVQFRYSPFAEGVPVPGAESGATVGVFMTGSNVFRDFTRDNVALGGAVYTSTFSDGANPYSHSLTTHRGWPGGTRAGSLWSFAPRRAVQRATPRLDYRDQAALAGLHHVSRPVSRGQFARPLAFDDQRSVMFTSDTVDLPTTLPRWVRGGHRSQDSYTGMTVTASVSPSAVEQWLQGGVQARRHRPFEEVGLHEQAAPDAVFFATGTQPRDAAGLSSSTRSKSIVRIDLPVQFSTSLDALTASAYYYDAATSQMTLIARATRQDPGSCMVVAGDAQLFGPFGHSLISGSYGKSVGENNFTPFQVSHPYAGLATTQQTVEAAMQYEQTGSATLSATHDPAANGILTLKASAYIDRPFLVEKAVFELPFVAGAGWFNDRTRTVLDNVSVPPGDVPLELSADAGGPCVTVALLNCLAVDRRDVIASGTIVPTGDVAAESTFTYYATGGIGAGPVVIYEHTIEGFSGYGGVPSAVVTPNRVGSQFTGTVVVQAEARVTNGYVVLASGKNYFTTLSSSAAYMTLETGRDIVDLASPSPGAYFLHSLNAYGRSMSGFDPAGRSIFGKEHTSPAYAKGTLYGVTNPFAQVRTQALAQLASSALFTGSYLVLPNVATFVGNSSVSPYLLLPTDNLALCVTKHRPARSALSRSYAGTFADFNAGVGLTGSHDVGMATGTIRITLYGSHLKAGAEHHDVLGQTLSSADLFEIEAGGEAVLDQYELEHRAALSGSLFDAYMTGTMVATVARQGMFDDSGRLLVGRRERAFSMTTARSAGSGALSEGSVTLSLVPAWELAGDIRNSQCVSATERLYDSMLPSYEAISRLNGAQIVSYVDDDLSTVTGSWIFLDASGSIAGDVPLGTTDGVWSWAYPFEPRYATVVRQDDLVRSVVTRAGYDGDVVTAHEPKRMGRLVVAAATRFVDTVSIDYVMVADFLSGVAVLNSTTPPSNDAVKALYGFGDNNLRRAVGTGNNTFYVGPTHFPAFRRAVVGTINRSDVARSVSPIIRGWKYGLANGFPQHSRTVFRRGRFGQFRDMLEQRHDTKFFVSDAERRGTSFMNASPVTVSFFAYPTSGSGPVPTRPWQTSTSNASPEATSSLPYFDGEARN